MTGMISRASVVAAVLVVTLAGCGGGDDSDAGQPEASGAVETLPSCDETWVVGETLPADYDGCVITGNEVQVFSPGECPSGAQYATYEDRYYAVPGEAVQEVTSGDMFSDPDFTEFTESC